MFFLIFNFLNWSITVLQCCAGFCHTAAGISRVWMHMPSLGASLPCAMQQRCTSCLLRLHTLVCTCHCYRLYASRPLLPPRCPQHSEQNEEPSLGLAGTAGSPNPKAPSSTPGLPRRLPSPTPGLGPQRLKRVLSPSTASPPTYSSTLRG